MPSPHLRVSLLEAEDTESYVNIRHEAFRGTVNRLLYSRAKGCEPSPMTLNKVHNDIRDQIIKKSDIFLKCEDTSVGEIVACARWRYIQPKEKEKKERTWDEVDTGLVIPEPYDETDPELFEEVFGLFNIEKRAILGTKPYYLLDTLVTHPEHCRKGAGSLLVNWGCEKADEAGVIAYLEATPMGAPLYTRYGFEVCKYLHFDMKNYGQDESMDFILMLRQPKN